MWDKLTRRAMQAIHDSTEEARSSGATLVDPEHLLLALLRDEQSYAVMILRRRAIPIEAIRDCLLESCPKRQSDTASITFSDGLHEVFAYATNESARMRHTIVGTEHLLLGLLDGHASPASQLLHDHGVESAGFRDGLAVLLAELRETN